MTKEYDLVVLGGGTGGYVAAIRAAQLGMRVGVVEARKLGGTCLHHGCIPSKALLRSAEVYRQTMNATSFGIETKDTTLNFINVQERKDQIVNSLHQGVQSLMKKGKIDIFEGYGRILGPSIFSPMAGTISIEYINGDENTMIVPKNVLIATGSEPKSLPDLKVDGTHVLSSIEALEMKELPESIIIIGGGAIGIEWASMLIDFGVEVTVIEQMDRILPLEDEDVSREIERLLKKKGIIFVKEANVIPKTLAKENGVSVGVDIDNENKTFDADMILVSVGRKANTEDIGITNTTIEVKNGFIQTNKNYQTKESHIYAVGDVIGGMQLAHVASNEGIVAVEHMANKDPLPIDYNNVPSCVYSDPEIASVGLTEQQALEEGLEIKVGKFPFKAIGKALVNGSPEGFVKVITNKDNEDILGVHMVGSHVTDMISEVGLAKTLDATAWEITQSIHPHPTLSEIIGEASLAVEGLQIHG